MANFSTMFYVFFLIFFASIASSNQSQALTNSINSFSADFFAQVSTDNKHAGNDIFLSGMSAHIVLTLLSLGATGKTLNDMDNTLYIDLPTKYQYKDAIKKMNSYKNVNMIVADKIYVKEGPQYTLNPAYQESAQKIFYSEVDQMDFNQPDDAAGEINSWVEYKTKKTVKDIVKGGDFNYATVVVLVNTIYLQGQWDKQFNKDLTTEQPFYVSKTKTVNVQMMLQHNTTDYGENEYLDAKVLKLAFQGQEASMVFFLPNKYDGLAAMEKKLKNVNIHTLVNNLKPEEVTISMPKINIETAANLNDDLTDLGMGIVFNDNATFEGIPANPTIPLKVENVFQKTYLDLNEGGVNSGGGDDTTDVNILPLSNEKQFTANHPFFFVAINEDGPIVFSGHFLGQNNNNGYNDYHH